MRFHSVAIVPKQVTLVIVLLFLCAPAQNQESPKVAEDPERRTAFEAYDQGKMVQAMPMLEGLSAKYPTDIAIKERWAFSMMAYAATLKEPEQRKKVRARARNIGLEAQKLGDSSPLLLSILDVPADGSESPSSGSPEVVEAMKIAEADFVRGNYDKARDGYMRVMLLDPNNYAAALFTGDVFFKQHMQGSAGEWFARAVQLDPNRETAYRYWADSLLALGKNDESREKFIQAVVAEPYVRRTWEGLTKWAQYNKSELHFVKLQNRGDITIKDEKTINITVDLGQKDDLNSLAWLTYNMSRASWHGDRFKKEFPNEPQYRHTLKEETDSLSTMLAVLKEQKDFKKKQNTLDPGLIELFKLQDAGFIEAFVLINRADDGIAQDYSQYRERNREKIRAYLDEFVVPKAPGTH